jgi:tellurite resistance protein TerB
MALWDQLKSRVADFSAQAKTKVGQYKSKEFANASMAMCALIAAADGSIDPVERGKTEGFIASNEPLKVFPTDELLQKFDFYATRLQKDYEFGKTEAIATIGKLRKDPGAARTVIQLGIIIGGADGNFDPDEKQAVRDACNAVGIAPAEFDL